MKSDETKKKKNGKVYTTDELKELGIYINKNNHDDE
jgi:hypothetical protein